MSETSINQYQKAIVETFQQGRLSGLAEIEDYKQLIAKLKKDPNATVLVAIVESLRGIEDTNEASSRLITAEVDVQAAMASVGAISIRQSMSMS